jgi:hypothetical protein
MQPHDATHAAFFADADWYFDMPLFRIENGEP